MNKAHTLKEILSLLSILKGYEQDHAPNFSAYMPGNRKGYSLAKKRSVQKFNIIEKTTKAIKHFQELDDSKASKG